MTTDTKTEWTLSLGWPNEPQLEQRPGHTELRLCFIGGAVDEGAAIEQTFAAFSAEARATFEASDAYRAYADWRGKVQAGERDLAALDRKRRKLDLQREEVLAGAGGEKQLAKLAEIDAEQQTLAGREAELRRGLRIVAGRLVEARALAEQELRLVGTAAQHRVDVRLREELAAAYKGIADELGGRAAAIADAILRLRVLAYPGQQRDCIAKLLPSDEILETLDTEEEADED